MVHNNEVRNDTTLDLLAKMALSHVKQARILWRPGHDGRPHRRDPDSAREERAEDTVIMSYAVKYARRITGRSGSG